MKYFVLSYYPLEVAITETTIFSNSFVTWSQISMSCDQRHLWDPQNKQLTWVLMRERDRSATSTTLWWGSTVKTQLPHLSATAKMICPWMLNLFSLQGPENLGRSLSPDPHQDKWAHHPLPWGTKYRLKRCMKTSEHTHNSLGVARAEFLPAFHSSAEDTTSPFIPAPSSGEGEVSPGWNSFL